ncbi:DUF4115 domain-containing protein, partial [Ralstonia pseudosolanacearum]|uniref:DUF4115 domain-containing protein n=1 Tax=Ralstonia pseudosolanacearum TaxID=1310165 RepID=UPI003D18183C
AAAGTTHHDETHITKSSGFTLGLSGSALSVRFSGASWYEIKDKSGKTLVSGLARDGDARDVNGTPPFKVVFGNAEAVESLTVSGAPVDIRKYARNRVARATLP